MYLASQDAIAVMLVTHLLTHCTMAYALKTFSIKDCLTSPPILLDMNYEKRFDQNWIKSDIAVRVYFWTFFANLDFLNVGLAL